MRENIFLRRKETAMKKYLTAIFALIIVLSLASCGTGNNNDNGTDKNNSAGNNMGNAATDITDGIDNAATDMTDGTIFDTDKNYNVDDYSGNAPGVA